MTLLLSNEDVEKALTPESTISATEQIYRELAEGARAQPGPQPGLPSIRIEEQLRIPLSLQIAGGRKRRDRRLGAQDYIGHGWPFVHRGRQTEEDSSGRDGKSILRVGDPV